jgi:type I restriction enzyme S subunit
MAGEWKEMTLGDVATLQRGFDLPIQKRKPGKVPIVSSSGISDHHSEPAVRGPGVITGRYGTIGQVFLVTEDYWPLNTTLWVKDFHGNDPRFVAYLLKTVDFLSCSDKSSVPGVNRNDLHRLPVLLPPLPQQKRIAHILGTLDDKIELNRRMNATLEGISRALFKSWFVDFDPVRQKAAGKQPVGMDAQTAALFPDSFEDSEIGEVPMGWRVMRASDLYEVAIGKTPPRKEHQWFSESPVDIPWMSIKDLGEAGAFILKVSEYLTPEAVEKFRVRRIPNGTVVLSFKLTVGRVAITDGEMLSNEAIAHFLPLTANSPQSEYLYCYLKHFDYGRLGSTSSIATAVNSDGVRSIPIITPGDPLVSAFCEKVRGCFMQIKSIQRQSQSLAALRDTLLPKLLSGEIRVSDAEPVIPAVVCN